MLQPLLKNFHFLSEYTGIIICTSTAANTVSKAKKLYIITSEIKTSFNADYIIDRGVVDIEICMCDKFMNKMPIS